MSQNETLPAGPKKSSLRRNGCMVLLVLILAFLICAGVSFYQHLEQENNYEAGHAAYLKADCPAAVLLFDLAINGGGFGGENGDAAKLAVKEKAECVAWQEAMEAHNRSNFDAALTGYAALLEIYPQTPLLPLVQSQMESLFRESASLAGQANPELCRQFQTLRVQGLVPAQADALPPLLWACGQVFEESDDPGRAVELYAQLLNDYPDHALAQETIPALARATVAQAKAAGAGNIPAPQSVGGTGSGPAVVVIQNASPEKISLVFNGPESRLEELDACADCDRYSGDGPAACPEQGSVGVYEVPAGTYDVVVNSSSDKGVIPFIGQWNLNQGEEYHSCFFLVTAVQ